MAANTRGKATMILLVAQVAFILMYAFTAEYDVTAGATDNSDTTEHHETLKNFYPMFQDVHVMMIIGFGFLMTFLKRHGFGSVGFNFLLTSFVIQWALLINGYFSSTHPGKALLNIFSMLEADFAVATVLISFGGVLGVASPVQLIVMATLEVVFYNLSIYVGIGQLGAIDVGGSIFIHAFGAYFGLAVSIVLSKFSPNESSKETSNYQADIFAMIGTLFLWLYWPSFNAGPAEGNERQRAVINTILSLSACTVTTFAISQVVNKKNKLSMVHIQNATLAGGVAMGSSANLITTPYGAVIVGILAGILSTCGYAYLTPLLQRKIGLHDTCGIHNLHGMPGIMGAITSAVFMAAATPDVYGDSWQILFGDRNPATEQAPMQIAAMAAGVGIALVGGAMTGLVISMPFLDRLEKEDLYDDDTFWLTEGEEA
jgi:ammonium transporter Rh